MVEAWAPAGEPETLGDHDSRVADFMDALGPWDGAAGASHDSWSARISVVADDVGDAILNARKIVEDLASRCRLPRWRIEHIDAVEGIRYEEEILPPDLMSHPWGYIAGTE